MASTMAYPAGFPKKEFGWKGQIFYQVTATIQRNSKNAKTLSSHQLMKPLPLTIYRREIHDISGQVLPKNCNSRISLKVSDFETPGNNTVSRTLDPYYSNGLVNTLDINPTTLSAENGACNTSTTCFLSPQLNARRRCRSAGMMPRKFNTAKNNDTYSSSTHQYLVSRNRTIKQNEYNYIRKGSSGIVPGPGLTASNIYSPGGLSHCSQPTVSISQNNNYFSYAWADGAVYTATIPQGTYDIQSLNQAFMTIQIENLTYLLDPYGSKVFLMNISFDNNTQSVILYAGVTNSATGYTEPFGATWAVSSFPATDPTPSPPSPSYTLGATYYIIPDTNIQSLLGFFQGTYFGGINESSSTSQIQPSYVPLYYKPNNPQFGVQGAVDASTKINRLKYNTITSGAAGIRSAYGNAASAALSYGVSEQAYTIKTAVGDKWTYTPVVNPRTGQICKKQFIFRM